MESRHWGTGVIENGYGDTEGLILRDSDGDARVVSISHTKRGAVAFTEECDGYFALEVSKEEAVEILQEAIAYIQSQGET